MHAKSSSQPLATLEPATATLGDCSSNEPVWEHLAHFPSSRLSCGRSLEVETDGQHDRLTIRAASGAVVLSVEVGDHGPVLRFEAAELQLAATRALRLSAETIEVEAKGDMNTKVGGTHHTRVEGAERLEAARVELQANEEEVVIRAREDIRIDGEHIGLNDDLAPAPLPWTSAALAP